jgi:hypothetical protein
MLKDLVQTIGHLCEQSRNTHETVQNAARDLSSELAALRESIQHGASGGALLVQLESIRRKEAALEDVVKSLGT